ncbi:hypothetical protein KOW79_012668 [Hemibagrus wyckioides]|uniref:Uncharacterized protein n=1 Tax=Hemibagrus wyckioides TaxID=337641 RepID=A0A9D3SHS8_9TELE|nr:hypothetical protein KOW79_012668 [Hemibagrus wyckioides]
MRLLTLTALSLCITVHTAECAIHNQTHSERNDTLVPSNKDGNGTWSKDVDGGRANIQTAPHDPETAKMKPNGMNQDVSTALKSSGKNKNQKKPKKTEKEKPKNPGSDEDDSRETLHPSTSLFLVVAALLAGAGLVLILNTSYKAQTPEPCVSEHYYETIDDVVATAPVSKKPLKTVYTLANHPAKPNLASVVCR